MNNDFYTPKTIRPLYDEIIPAYQSAFAAPPWNEVSKCVDKQVRCDGGLSATQVGNLCDKCELRPTQTAYEADELASRFDEIGLVRPTAWYVERGKLGLTMAAVAWKASPSEIASEKYTDAPEMSSWITNKLGDKPVMWLDEVFANRQLRSQGNLRNFGSFILGLARILDCSDVAYRTIEPRMNYVAQRDFGEKATVWQRRAAVPDRRDFVAINNLQEVL